MSQDTTRRPWGWAYVHSPLTASVCIGERCPADMQGLPNVKPVFLDRRTGAAQDVAAAVDAVVVTAEMVAAGAAAARLCMQETGGNDPAVIYRAMHARAPTAPAVPGMLPMPPFTPEQRAAACVAACEGLPDHALYGGWTAVGLSRYAKSLEDTQAAPATPVPLTDAQLEQERALFERTCSALNVKRDASGAYSLKITKVAWVTWWAARQVSAGISADSAKGRQC